MDRPRSLYWNNVTNQSSTDATESYNKPAVLHGTAADLCTTVYTYRRHNPLYLLRTYWSRVTTALVPYTLLLDGVAIKI